MELSGIINIVNQMKAEYVEVQEALHSLPGLLKGKVSYHTGDTKNLFLVVKRQYDKINCTFDIEKFYWNVITRIKATFEFSEMYNNASTSFKHIINNSGMRDDLIPELLREPFPTEDEIKRFLFVAYNGGLFNGDI